MLPQAPQENLNFIDRAKEKGTKILAGTLIALGAIGLAGCANDAEAKPSPSASETVQPSEQPTTEAPTTSSPETPDPSEPAWFDLARLERPELPAELQKYRDMSVQEFQKLPVSERWIYVSYLTSYRADFENTLSMVGAGMFKPVTLTPESTGEDLLALYQTGDAAPNPTMEGTCGPFASEDAQKILSAVYAFDNTTTANAVTWRNAAISDMETATNGQAICPTNIDQLAHPFNFELYAVTGSQPTTAHIDGQELSGMSVSFKNDYLRTEMGGGSFVYDLVQLPVQNYDGTTTTRAVFVDPMQ
jgi:hypothetical protein